mmetsp:Transcript_3688/g.10665  ORF Transcript_3688/g.10665 Transcript_3688/m.10665 type:complete len:336 (+) Transcript_3688:17-1024(+)
MSDHVISPRSEGDGGSQRSLQLGGHILIVRPLDSLVVLGSHVGVHVANHHDDPVLLAVEAVHAVVVAPVPGDDLALLPRVGLVRDDELRALQAGEADVDVQDVVGGPAVRLHVGPDLHLDHHHLLVLVRGPRQARLRGQPLLQERAGLREHRLALLGELPVVVQEHAVPLALVVEEAVRVLEAARGLVRQRALRLLEDGLVVVLELLADGQVPPGLARPHLHVPQAAHPHLRGVLVVVPGDRLVGGVGPHFALPGHGGHLLEEVLGLLDPPCVLVLQDGDLPVERHAAALQLRLRVEVAQALLVRHQLLGKVDASHDEVVVPVALVEDVLHGIEV